MDVAIVWAYACWTNTYRHGFTADGRMFLSRLHFLGCANTYIGVCGEPGSAHVLRFYPEDAVTDPAQVMRDAGLQVPESVTPVQYDGCLPQPFIALWLSWEKPARERQEA